MELEMGEDNNLQYVRYSAKELLELLTNKVDRLDEKVDQLVIAHATLPVTYVTQEQVEKNEREAKNAKRWAVMATIASVGALGSFIALVTG